MSFLHRKEEKLIKSFPPVKKWDGSVTSITAKEKVMM